MSFKIALILIQKNESLLLEPWIQCHASVIDTFSILSYDNGSTDATTLAILATAESIGFNIKNTYSQQKESYARGGMFDQLIQGLDASHPHDFDFPIDGDESLACDRDGKISCQRDVTLAPLVRDGKVLTRPHQYVNNSYRINRYSKVTTCKKYFFAQGACEALSDGFHEGKSKNGKQECDAKIPSITLHCKPCADHMRLSAQKVEYLRSELSRKNLVAYAKSRKSSYHAAHSLPERESCRRYLDIPSTTFNSCPMGHFRDLGISTGCVFSDQSINTLKGQMAIRAKHLAMKAQDQAEEALAHLRSITGFIKRRLLKF